MPLALDQKVGAVVWSPLGWGRLTGKIRRGQPLPETSRLQSKLVPTCGPPVADEYLYRRRRCARRGGAGRPARPCRRSRSTGCCSGRPWRPSIIGARNEEQLRQNLGAVGWNLTPEQVAKLDAASATHAGLSLLAPARLRRAQSAAGVIRARAAAAPPARCARRRSPPGPRSALGALAFGTTARSKPSLAASFRRSWPRGAGRTSPARPTSPKAMKPRGSGLPRSDDSGSRAAPPGRPPAR